MYKSHRFKSACWRIIYGNLFCSVVLPQFYNLHFVHQNKHGRDLESYLYGKQSNSPLFKHTIDRLAQTIITTMNR